MQKIAPHRNTYETIRIVAIYSLFGSLWIYLSDSVLGWLVGDPAIITRLSIYKGWLFIALTALLLYVLIARYVAGREKIERQLRQSEEKFSTAFRTSPDSICIIRLSDNVYLEVNEGFCSITGLTVGAVIGSRPSELGLWPSRDELERLRNEIDRFGIAKGVEVVFRRPDGMPLTGQLSARIIEIGGEPCLLCVTRDITEQKHAEESLRRNEQELRSLLEMMPVGVGSARDDGSIEYVNRSFTALFGYSLAEVPTVEAWSRLAYPDPAYRERLVEEWYGKIDQARRLGRMEVEPLDVQITCKDGTLRQVILSTQLVQNRTMVIMTDITERESAQRELVKMQKLESLGILAGGIAHDFNNILTGILGNITFAQMKVAADSVAGKALSNAESAAKRAAELAHQLLTFARGGEPVKKSVDLRILLEESLELVLAGSNVKARLELPEGIRPLEADEGQISQVINNLLINAVQAMPGGGTVRIIAENVELSSLNGLSLEAGEYVRIRVTDQGCGIAADDLKRVFDPYFTTKPFGNGLGLSSVYSIVTRHGGHIGVQSEPGAGAEFTLLLPAAGQQALQLADQGSIAPDPERRSGTILVLDDESMIRDMIRSILTSLGYQVVVCETGEEVLQQCRDISARGECFSALIMDLTIPGGMGGKELAPLILEIDPEAVMIVSSGYSNDPVMANYAGFGFKGVLPKPYNAREIVRVLAEIGRC